MKTDEGKEREETVAALADAIWEERYGGVTREGATAEARRLLRAHDARVWEEAAKVCDEEAEKHRKHDDPCRMDAARWCASALRARAPKGEKP